jgi:hypothetical protein
VLTARYALSPYVKQITFRLERVNGKVHSCIMYHPLRRISLYESSVRAETCRRNRIAK